LNVGPSWLPATHLFPFSTTQQLVALQFFFVNLVQDSFKEAELLLQKSDIGFKLIVVQGLLGSGGSTGSSITGSLITGSFVTGSSVSVAVLVCFDFFLFFNPSIFTTCTTFLFSGSGFIFRLVTSINIIKANITITPIKIFKTLLLEKSIFCIYIKVYIKLNILYIHIYMSKSRSKSRSSRKSDVMKSLKKTTSKAVPMVKSGLKSVGSTVKTVAIKSAPTVNKGLGEVYGALATGFDMGIKGVSKMTKKSRSSKRSSKRSKRGGTSRRY
jgi:hypothetical protein